MARYFKGVAVKKLSAVEANPSTSHQHEFNGTNVFKRLLGTGEKKLFQARFVWMGDEQEAITEDGSASWYDARERHPTRSEYRLYYPNNAVMRAASEGDTLFVALRADASIMFIVVPKDSTVEQQLLWLFGLAQQRSLLRVQAQEFVANDDGKLDFAVRHILEELGIEPEEPEADELDAVLEKYGTAFPSMAEFSALARGSLRSVNAHDDPDDVIVRWMDREEMLFRRLERRIIEKRINRGFGEGTAVDVDGFVGFSLSVQNRRKARAGAALENHLAELFSARKVLYGRGCTTELRNRPDFLFPSCESYDNSSFPEACLSMLAAKSTLKERWRQVFSEANRIPEKHLMTLSPGISFNQIAQMQAERLRLVVPSNLHQTYHPTQRGWLMSLSQFIELVQARQKQVLV